MVREAILSGIVSESLSEVRTEETGRKRGSEKDIWNTLPVRRM